MQINCGSRHASIDTRTAISARGVGFDPGGGSEAPEYAPLVWPQQACAGSLAWRRQGLLASWRRIAKARPLFQADHRPGARLTDPITELNYGTDGGGGRTSVRHHARQSDAYAVESHSGSPTRKRRLAEGEVENRVRARRKFYDTTTAAAGLVGREACGAEACIRAPLGPVTAATPLRSPTAHHGRSLPSEDAVAKHGRRPKAVIVDSQMSALDSSIMGLGPVLSATELLTPNNCRCRISRPGN